MQREQAFLAILRKFCILSCLASSLVQLPIALEAQEQITDKSAAEVIALYGEPGEKIEQEVLRQEVWIYPDERRIVFEDGLAKSLVPAIPSRINEIEKRDKYGSELGSERPSKQLAQSEVEEILSEIMGEPSGENEKTSR